MKLGKQAKVTSPRFEESVLAWTEYLKATREMVGHLPESPVAMRTGVRAMQRVMPGASLSGAHLPTCWKKARLEAVRRLGGTR